MKKVNLYKLLLLTSIFIVLAQLSLPDAYASCASQCILKGYPLGGQCLGSDKCKIGYVDAPGDDNGCILSNCCCVKNSPSTTPTSTPTSTPSSSRSSTPSSSRSSTPSSSRSSTPTSTPTTISTTASCDSCCKATYGSQSSGTGCVSGGCEFWLRACSGYTCPSGSCAGGFGCSCCCQNWETTTIPGGGSSTTTIAITTTTVDTTTTALPADADCASDCQTNGFTRGGKCCSIGGCGTCDIKFMVDNTGIFHGCTVFRQCCCWPSTTITTTTISTTTISTSTTTDTTPPTTPPTTPVTVPPTTPVSVCSASDAPKCEGMARQACIDANGDGALEWSTIESPSEACCTDGDCSSLKCTTSGGSWLTGKTSPDFSTSGKFCCGDDGNTDLANLPIDSVNLCVKDGTFKWITGVNATRFVGNRILFCQHNFSICFNETPYLTLDVSDKCTNKCNFYCEPQFDKWLNERAPEGLNILSDPLKPSEQIDSEKFDLSGKSGCCPSPWCWNGTKCIENQIDEPLNIYTINNSAHQKKRCQDGSWVDAKLVFSWDSRLKGYCPDKDKQCLVSNQTYSNNNKPNTYFTSKKPQCIRTGQYILDNYCNESEWVSRTSLVATKLLQLGSGESIKLLCDDYTTVFNDYNYAIGADPAWKRLGRMCKIDNETVKCANNVCVLRNIVSGKTWIGTSLNVGLCDTQHGLAPALGLTGCNFPSTNGPFAYARASATVIVNTNASIVLFSSPGIEIVPTTTGWELFRNFLAQPIATISQLVITGQLQYHTLANVLLNFDVLNSSKMFSKVYIADYNGRKIQGIFEENRFDPVTKAQRNYMIINYSGFTEDICGPVNRFASQFNRINCNKSGSAQVVLDSREGPSASFLMGFWADLTTKFK